jgi:hypothetical protein
MHLCVHHVSSSINHWGLLLLIEMLQEPAVVLENFWEACAIWCVKNKP